MDILEQLRALEKRKKKAGGVSNVNTLVTARDIGQLREQKKASLERFIPGQLVENDLGRFFLLSETYSPDYLQGIQPLPRRLDPFWFNRFAAGEEEIEGDRPHLVYLDTETTGLAGGAGTFAFLVGLGYWRRREAGEEFVVEQFFMRDYDEEPALLAALDERIQEQQFEGLVTYNGRCFDIPLLITRFISNRRRDRLARLPHLDLLYPVRQLWKLKHGDCSLGNIEKQVLGVRREGDIPGEEIPRTYFQFVRGGDPRRLLPIFSHNVIDILSLAALTGRVLEQVATTPEQLDPVEVYSLGRMHLRQGALEQASLFLQKSDRDLLPAQIYLRSQKELALAYKRNGDWDRAVEVWMQTVESYDAGIAANEERPDLFAFEELAKYYEHQAKDYFRAIEMVGRALEQLRAVVWPELEEELQHRLLRLQKKTDKGKSITDSQEPAE